MEEKAYVWQEYARGDEQAEMGGEANKFVAGKMFLVKFGSRPHDPIWPVDILISQAEDAPIILSYLLSDALEGFPVPFYPSSSSGHTKTLLSLTSITRFSKIASSQRFANCSAATEGVWMNWPCRNRTRLQDGTGGAEDDSRCALS